VLCARCVSFSLFPAFRLLSGHQKIRTVHGILRNETSEGHLRGASPTFEGYLTIADSSEFDSTVSCSASR
jgi:hypothetical protein